MIVKAGKISLTMLYLTYLEKVGEKVLAKQRDYKREYELAKQRGDKQKVIKFTVELPVEDGEKFKLLVKAHNTKPGTILKNWIYDYLEKNGE